MNGKLNAKSKAGPKNQRLDLRYWQFNLKQPKLESVAKRIIKEILYTIQTIVQTAQKLQ
jgi:hypothetical protein